MESRLDPQRGFKQRKLEIDIPPLQSEGVQFEATFLKSMMSEPTYTAGPFSQSSFTESPHTKASPHQAPHTPNHVPWMDLSAHISSLGTRMEELTIRIERIESRQESQHEEMMANLRSMFPPPPPQP
ncbi:hypothetical protein CK203_059211 [Vitis vinifera]|uniref:Uncharacterized protein n=1 Tax=Vitis vinifera TaxID=29760 RepID=A0A438GHX7_VITVI|nr:hypothetical protein CK203_059211 [Vitis vinifera]